MAYDDAKQVLEDVQDDSTFPEVEVLCAAKKLLVNTGWCQGTLARDEYGACVSTLGTEASSFCMLGALSRAAVRLLGDDYATKPVMLNVLHGLEANIRQVSGASGVASFNDMPGTRSSQVIAIFDQTLDDFCSGRRKLSTEKE